MRTHLGLFLSVLLFAIAFTGCGSGPAVNTANSNTANANSNNPLEAKTPAPDQTTNAAPTLTPVYKAYCEAWVKKDEAALRKIYSSDTIKYFESQMKLDKVPTLMKYLEDDAVTGKICEVRNEEIKGDTAVAEIRADSYPNGIKIVFVKENGEWRMTNRSPALDNVKPSANDAKTANAAPANATGDKKNTKKEGGTFIN
ncbi:hypothetical protein BH10ACI2_BH10ACI2_13950 [soil metagenome]